MTQLGDASEHQVFTMAPGSTVHIHSRVEPVVNTGAQPTSPTGTFGGSGSFGGPSVSFQTPHTIEIQHVTQPFNPVISVGGIGYTGGSYESPGFATSSAISRPTNRIVYGWVPEPQSASLQAMNIEELNSALRSEAFVQALRSRSQIDVRCNIPLATDKNSYLNAFLRTVQAERAFRKDIDEQVVQIEEALRRDQMADIGASYQQALATLANGEEGTQNEARADAARYKETVERLISARLEILMTCKLAALLGQPRIFTEGSFSSLDVLEFVATALGLSNESEESLELSEGRAVFGGLEPFLMTSNPLTLGHLLTLLIGHIDRELFFGANAKKPFYSFTTLMGATGGETAISLLDEMCDRDRGPHYKTPLLKRLRPKGRDGKPRVRGSTQPWFRRGGSRVHRNPQQPELLRAYCDTTEMILNAIMLKHEDIQQEMLKYSLPVEPLVDPATNAARIQTRTCRGMATVCSFENTILNPIANPLDPQAIDQNTNARMAYEFYTGLASAQLGNLFGPSGSRQSSVFAEQWVEMMSKPSAHSDILERVFFFDTREMTAQTKSTMVKGFEAYEKRISQLAGKPSVPFEEAARTYGAIQKTVQNQPPKKWYTRKPKITKRNLFRIAIILLLRSTISCDMKQSFAEKFEAFTKSVFFSGAAKGRRVPATQRTLMAFFRTGKAPTLLNMCAYDPLTLNYMFLYRFVLMGSDAARTHDRQHARVSKTRLSTRLLGSKWTPALLKAVMNGFRRKTMVKRAKALLLESLDPSILPLLIDSFDWIVHTQAALQVNQNSFMFHDLGARPESYQTTAESKAAVKLSDGGLVKLTDKQLKNWSEFGIPASLTNRLRKGEKLPKVTAFEKIPTPDLTKWELQLNTKWLEALTAYLQHPYGKAALAANDPVAMLIQESKNRLEAELETTIFLGRIVKIPRVSKFKRALRAVSNFFRMLLRSPEQSEYAVWMGVKVNIDQVMSVMKAVNSASEVVKSSGMYDHIKEGFLEIVKDVIMGNLDTHHRIVGYDTYAAVDEQMRKEGFAAAHKRNHGFLAIHPEYPNLSDAERKKEFQYSMCMDHCEALWKLLTSLVLTNMQNPKKLADYEKEMKSTKAITTLSDPNRVNAFRLGLNVQTDYFDNMLDKGSKDNIKRMKHGGGTWFAYSLLLAGRIQTAMGMPNLGTTLIYQAPYYGNFILKWIEERRKSRKKAIFAMMTLGFFFAYTFLSVADITQHLTDSGLGPAVECLENLVLGPICPAAVVAPAITSAATAAAQDVFKVGILGLLTPYLVLPMMLVSVWQILKSEFKILMQFEMSVKSLFTRFSRWVKQPFKNWWRRRRRMKESILKQASQKYESAKKKNNGREPRTRSFVERHDSGSVQLDAMGLPSGEMEVSYDVSWSTPIYPHSPPLVRVSFTK
ncbi:rhoptry neck protein 2 [Cyclospora cayetanensis]|uniref:Rhoptry neck protein 2 n=1 Tax=Cyclospora cayetanensis TaxID=88456 RepID=A0A6P5WCG8_9EIME|nr:rhoptry neck protein 2 [Cyclospora cayetanensis]